MILPIGTDRRLRRRPVITQAIIFVTMIVYIIGLAGAQFGWFEMRSFIQLGHFNPERIRVWQMITSLFLHDPTDLFHLGFNMVFLWVFGQGVEDRLGRWWFLGFYLLGGIMANLGHALLESAPCIGASGAISGVVGAYLALFPRSRVRVFVFFFIIGVFMIPSLWIIGLFFLIDVLSQTRELLGSTEGNVAYMAHIAGYVYGFTLCFVLLATNVIKREEYDVFFLIKQWRRRAAFRASMSRSGGSGWDAPVAPTPSSADQSRRAAPQNTSPVDQELAQERAAILTLLREHEIEQAAQRYVRALADSPDLILPEAQQLDVANQLQRGNQSEDAARVYELFLQHYPRSTDRAQVQLLLGAIYSRRMNQPDRARELLTAAATAVHGEEEKSLVQELLSEIGPRTP